ncbi:MAG: hypothetical protein DME24_07725 [Verrucomicrobia bacterium]|nr:MAG: hypothetical protein DME24_07725 [Verrucomicrobiota bacterium]
MNFNAANQILSAMFEWTWRTSLHASVLIVLVVLIQIAGRKWLAARWRYALGVLILLRLLLPAVPASPFSIFNLGKAVLPIEPQIEFGVVSPSSQPKAPSLPAVPERDAPLSVGVGIEQKTDWLKVVRVLWLFGLTASLLTALRQHRKFARRIAAEPPVGDERILSLLKSCRDVLGVRRRITAVIAPQPGTPAVFGYRKPRLLIPETALRKLDDRELRMVFLHELAHVKRGDILLNWAIILARSLHWFNPLVWLALRRLRADRELVCDAMVMARLADGERRVYGNTLIKLLDDFSGAGFCPSLAPVINHKHEIKRRVTMIAQFKPAGRVAVLLSAVIVVALCCFTFTRAAEKPAKKPAEIREAKHPEAQVGLESLKKLLEEEDAKVKEAQGRLDKLRSELRISDSLTEGEFLGEGRRSSGLSPETIQRLELERMSAEAEYRRLDSLSRLLQSKGESELQRIMNVAVPDELLTSLLKAKAECEQRLANLGSRFGPENADLKGVKEELSKINEQINWRVEGIMAGLRVRAEATQAQIKSLNYAVDEARARDAETVAPYFAAKRALENNQKLRDAIMRRILQETVDMQLPGAKPLEK